MSDKQIPLWLHEIALSLKQEVINKAIKAHEDSLERLKYSETEGWAVWINVLDGIKKVLQHPRGGTDAAIKLIDSQIELIHKFDAEEAQSE